MSPMGLLFVAAMRIAVVELTLNFDGRNGKAHQPRRSDARVGLSAATAPSHSSDPALCMRNDETISSWGKPQCFRGAFVAAAANDREPLMAGAAREMPSGSPIAIR